MPIWGWILLILFAVVIAGGVAWWIYVVRQMSNIDL